MGASPLVARASAQKKILDTEQQRNSCGLYAWTYILQTKSGVHPPPPREPASFVAMTLVLQSMTEYGVDDAGLDYRLIMMLAMIPGFVFGCLFFRVWPRTYASAAWRHKKYGCGGLLARSLIYLSLQTRLVTRRKRHDVCVERASVSMPQQSIRPAGYS